MACELLHASSCQVLRDAEKLTQVAEIIEASGFHDVAVHAPDGDEVGFIEFTSRRDGVERRVRFDNELLSSAEYRSLAGNSKGLESLCSSEFRLTKEDQTDTFRSLDEALEKLRGEDPAKAELVQLRFFAGLTLDQVACTLGISPATADRHWAYARAFLYQAIHGSDPD